MAGVRLCLRATDESRMGPCGIDDAAEVVDGPDALDGAAAGHDVAIDLIRRVREVHVRGEKADHRPGRAGSDDVARRVAVIEPGPLEPGLANAGGSGELRPEPGATTVARRTQLGGHRAL